MKNAYKIAALVFLFSYEVSSNQNLSKIQSLSEEINKQNPIIEELEKAAQKCADNICIQWSLYRKASALAHIDKEKSCSIFEILTKNKDWTLHPFVLIRMHETCPIKSLQTESFKKLVEEDLKKFESRKWMALYLQKILIDLGQSQLIVPTSKMIVNKREREKFILQWLNSPNALSKELTEDIKNELYTISPYRNPNLGNKSAKILSQLAQEAQTANEPDLAVKISFKALKLKNAPDLHIKRKLFETLRQAYKMKQRKDLALKYSHLTFQMDQKINNPKQILNSGLAYARALWTNQQTKSAELFLKKLIKTLKDRISLDDIYFLQARIEEEKGHFPQAISLFEKSSVPAYWNIGWLNYKLNNFEAAIKAFEQLYNQEQGDQYRHSSYLFWWGKAHLQLQQKEAAKEKFKKVIEEDGAGYYAFLSYRELNEPIPTLPPEQNKSFLSLQVDGFDTSLFQWLILSEEYVFAQQLLSEEWPSQFIDIKNENFISAFSAAEFFNPIFQTFVKLTTAEKMWALNNRTQTLHPLLFLEDVQKASEKTGLPKEYILAIIRQESSFNPFAVSPANAIGLMQLLPKVAKPIAKKLKIPYTDKEDLFIPSTSIALGAEHLKSYWKKSKNHFVLGTASYNASEGAVKNWLKNRPTHDTLKFIEDIPYEETRNYVKLVLRNMINYKRLTTPGPSISFPEDCLKPL